MESNIISLAVLVIISIWGTYKLLCAVAEHEHIKND